MDALLSAAVAGLATPPSLTRLTDAASGRPVLLVGTMHYNPHSISVVQGTVRAAAKAHGLHATCMELCDSRWNSTAADRWRYKRKNISALERWLSEDEFQVAYESTVAFSLLDDVVLADQPIMVTGQRLLRALAQSALDLLTPGGWCRVAGDLRCACVQLPTLAGAALDRRLLAGAPLAMARYVYQSPSAIPFAIVSTVALATAAAVDEATGAVASWQDALVSAILAVLFSRAAFVSLIRERDAYLARNIRNACLAREDVEAPGAAAVVAVLGMAHLAGVREALLKE